MVLHSELTIAEHHHHDGLDLFPDFGRQIPFGTGTSISYNYIDYRVRNDTSNTYQLRLWVDGEYLCGELRATEPCPTPSTFMQRTNISQRKAMTSIETAKSIETLSTARQANTSKANSSALTTPK